MEPPAFSTGSVGHRWLAQCAQVLWPCGGDGAINEFVGAGELNRGEIVIVVGIGHLESGLRRLQPPAARASSTFLVAGVHVLEREAGTGRLGDDANGIPLLDGPAAKVEDDARSASDHLVRDSDHSALEDVAATIGVDGTEQGGHPLIRCPAQDPMSPPAPLPVWSALRLAIRR